MDTVSGRAGDAGQALVNEAAARLHPSGFDPSRECGAVWRCAVADTIACVDVILTEPLKASKRKAERDLGGKLDAYLQTLFRASRGYAPANYDAAFQTGKRLLASAKETQGPAS